MNRALWPLLLTISTASLCLGLLDVPLDVRGAVRFVRPFHNVVTLITATFVVIAFWSLYRCVGWLRRRGAFLLSVFFIVLLFTVWAFTLPLGDRIAIHYERLDLTYQFRTAEIGDGLFYRDDSGMGDWPIQLAHLAYALARPWVVVMFLGFFPLFFHLYRNSNATESA